MLQTDWKIWQAQEMSNVTWAMATLERPQNDILEGIAREALRRGFKLFAPQAISNLVWGFAQLGYCNAAFLTVHADALTASNPALLPVSQCTPLFLIGIFSPPLGVRYPCRALVWGYA